MGNRRIIVFEHDRLYLGEGKQGLLPAELKTLQDFYGSKGTPYYSLINNGVKFCSYVGVLQVGKITIEVLPKTDRDDQWQGMLIAMLRTVGVFKVSAPSMSDLKLKSNSLLELYFSLFVSEVEYLVKRGLVKRYRKRENNLNALKGRLLIDQNIRRNGIHSELFYCSYTNYDTNHQFNRVLYATLKLLKLINTDMHLGGRVDGLLLDFPEQDRLVPTEAFFEKLSFDRKTEPYRQAITIAKLILLNYHPDVVGGRTHLLALLFDMNLLWEKFVYVSLKKHEGDHFEVTAQSSKPFWRSDGGQQVGMRPDLLIKKGDDCFVLDTKWKMIADTQPSSEDLRQLYVYRDYYQAKKVALVYPGGAGQVSGFFTDQYGDPTKKGCGVLSVPLDQDLKSWQESIAVDIMHFLEEEE